MSSPRLFLVGVVALQFALACGCGDAFMKGFNEGASGSAVKELDDAQAALDGCPASRDRDYMQKCLDKVRSRLANGDVSPIIAAAAGGSIRGLAEDGTVDSNDVEAYKMLYPEQLP